MGLDAASLTSLAVLGDDLRRRMLRLRNCPFHSLAAQAPELVCGLNQAFLSGYLYGLGSDKTTAILAPRPGSCCVELRGDEAAGRILENGTTCGR